MRRILVLGVGAALIAPLAAGCGSSSSADVPVNTATSPPAAITTGAGFNAAEVYASGDASQWEDLTAEQKLAVAQRYIAVSGSSSTPEAVAIVAEGGAALGKDVGTMRDFLAAVDDGASAKGAAPAPPVSTVEPKPDGKYTFRCNYVLGDFSSNTSTGFRLIASASVHNTGNIGTITKVTGIWDRLGTDPLKKTKTVKIRAGQTKRVDFTIPIDQDTLDLIQAANGDCRVRSSIAGTFGSAR